MRKKPLALFAGMLATGVVAGTPYCWADAPQPQPAVAGGQVAAIKAGNQARKTLVASPTISQTTAVRMPDGSIGVVCEQKRNPGARAPVINKPAPEPQQ